MSRRHRPSRLGLKFLAVAAVALAAALALRALLYDTVLPGLLQSAGFESYWYDRYGGAGEDFQRYVSAHGLTAQEALRDTGWTRQHPQVELYLESPADASLDTGALENYGGRVIACGDGLLYAYPMPNYFYYDGACRILSLLCAALCFFLILIPYTALLIRRITRCWPGGICPTRWCQKDGTSWRSWGAASRRCAWRCWSRWRGRTRPSGPTAG